MQEYRTSDELFTRLLRRELWCRRAKRLVLIVLAAVTIGLATDVLLIEENGREGFRLGATTTGTVTEWEPAGSQKRVWVKYRYTVKGVVYTDRDFSKVGTSTPAVGERVEVKVSAFGPQIARLTRLETPSLLSRVPWLLAAIFLIWVIIRRIRALFAPRNRRLRNTLAALANPPGEQADLREFYSLAPIRWRGWPPDDGIHRVMKQWLAKQPREVPAAEVMALLYQAELLFHPEEYPRPSLPTQTPTAFPTGDDGWALTEKSAEIQGWRKLQEGTATTMVLNLRNLHEETQRRECEEQSRRFAGVLREIGLTKNAELMRRKCEEAGVPLNQHGIVPLRLYAGDSLVADDLLSACDALCMIDETMVRFGHLPQPNGPRHGKGWMKSADKNAAPIAVTLDYHPGVELRLEIGAGS